ncbi:MAG: FHA domain-containing protein [Pseudomonadales bacterium]|nr:FHA domain-containing protein [Pseudomonadales bacterium]MBO6658321.1 FHA domain-containing protein [Pseudomonadales bacterium]
MSRENVEVGVLFADVTGSTRLYETLGDENANRIIGKTIDIMAAITEGYQGFVIKTIGDEIMCRFPSANDCVRAAIECQEEISAGIQGETVEVSIKAGLHYGPAILMEDGDVFGDAVNVAARMAGIAKGAQIITTQDTINLLDADLQDMSRQFDRTNVKGKEEEIIVYQVVWEESDDVTRIEISSDDLIEEVKHLSLDFQGNQQRIASDDHRTFVIGRGVQSDLLCKTRLASRSHATLEFRRGKFILTDQSSNGTFVKTDDGENIFLRRQELMLWGSGYIGLGEEVSKEDPDNLIRYICE